MTTGILNSVFDDLEEMIELPAWDIIKCNESEEAQTLGSVEQLRTRVRTTVERRTFSLPWLADIQNTIGYSYDISGRISFDPMRDRTTELQQAHNAIVNHNMQIQPKMRTLFRAHCPPRPRVPLAAHVRWMIRPDTPQVLDIETMHDETPLQEPELVQNLRERNCIGMVADDKEEDRVAGVIIFHLHKSYLNIQRLIVHDDYRHRSVGTQLVNCMKNKLSSARRNRITTIVRETNLPIQIFLRKQKFKAHLLRDHFQGPTEDGYLMTHWFQEKKS